MNDCQRCGAPHACFGLAPPAVPEQQWFCGECVELQPYTQRKLAVAARAAIDEKDIMDA
jgi:hypothetical protein